MRRSFNSGKGPSFQKIVISSFVIHLVFIAVTAVPLVHKKREIKPYYVNLVNPVAIHRPEAVSDLKSNVPVTKKKVEERTKKIPSEKNIKKKTKPKMSMDSKVSKLIDDKIKEQQREKEEKARRLAEIKENAKKEAEDVSETAETPNPYAGMGSYDARLLYESKVRYYIEAFWEIPKNIDVEELISTIEIKINKDLKIVAYKIVKPSGVRLFDRSVSKALLDAKTSTEFEPFPAPPLEFLEEAINEGIEFKFYYEK